jgi:hypothetical protein
MNEFEVMQVQEDLAQKGYFDFELQPGNDCVWAAVRSGSAWLDFFYIFRDGQIADIQVD